MWKVKITATEFIETTRTLEHNILQLKDLKLLPYSQIYKNDCNNVMMDPADRVY
jgi:hypothetical protein